MPRKLSLITTRQPKLKVVRLRMNPIPNAIALGENHSIPLLTQFRRG